MPPISMPLLARACRMFLELSYPGGPATIPKSRQVYYDIPGDAAVELFLDSTSKGNPICQELRVGGFAFRLGSEHYPHLKLKVQPVETRGQCLWVFSVDTHDAFAADMAQPPPDHPDARRWHSLQVANRVLKEKIEAVWKNAGIVTLNGLLRNELEKSKPVLERA